MYDDVYLASFGRKYIYGRLTSHKKSLTLDLGLTDLKRKQNSCNEFILVTIQDKLNLDTRTTSNDSISLSLGVAMQSSRKVCYCQSHFPKN